MYAALSRRPTTGWPEPVTGGAGRCTWYSLKDLRQYRKQRDATPPQPVDGEPGRSHHKGYPISLQTVKRLRRRARERDTTGST